MKYFLHIHEKFWTKNEFFLLEIFPVSANGCNLISWVLAHKLMLSYFAMTN